MPSMTCLIICRTWTEVNFSSARSKRDNISFFVKTQMDHTFIIFYPLDVFLFFFKSFYVSLKMTITFKKLFKRWTSVCKDGFFKGSAGFVTLTVEMNFSEIGSFTLAYPLFVAFYLFLCTVGCLSPPFVHELWSHCPLILLLKYAIFWVTVQY